MQRKLPKVLSQTEIDALYSVTPHPRDRAAIALMEKAALRVSEAADLQLGNIIWEEQILRFVGKGGTEAEVAMSNALRDILEKAITARPTQATHDFVLWDKTNPAKSIKRHALGKLVAKKVSEAGITRRITPHCLRHTCLTHLFRQTGDLARVQKAARHEKPQTTTIYTHLATSDLKKDMELLDRRPRMIRWWSRLKPTIIPELLQRKSKPFYIGETVGREKEVSRLRKNLRTKTHSGLVGPRGVGKTHLLGQLEGENLYRLESIQPLRESLVILCQQLVSDGLLEKLPTGRSTTPFIEALREVGKERDLTVVIDSVDDAERKEIRAVRKLADSWTIFTSISLKQQEKLDLMFIGNFGSYDKIIIENLDKQASEELARKAIADMPVQDMKAYLNFLWTSSEGSPRIILDLIEASRQTGDLNPEHPSTKTLSASPFLSFLMMAAVISRYSASALSEPSIKLYAIIILLTIAPFLVLDHILKKKAQL